ncbi:hypothetical protein CEXT_311281 [Caerostris extrusa]|uniref:Uncharacterized protein n=1 Tax=Caerostris extrusa TaxID=172846 RepID=A0AAV4NWT1_CAEEX|nr:hypothetical protein CEXT_311281 [Caerostris extrusa]
MEGRGRQYDYRFNWSRERPIARLARAGCQSSGEGRVEVALQANRKRIREKGKSIRDACQRGSLFNKGNGPLYCDASRVCHTRVLFTLTFKILEVSEGYVTYA